MDTNFFVNDNKVYFMYEGEWLFDDLPVINAYDKMHLFHKGQTDIINLMLHNHKGFILNEQQTGKTAATLYTIDLLQRIRAVRNVLILAPLGAIRKEGWLGESEKIINREIINLRKIIAVDSAITSKKRDIFIANYAYLRKDKYCDTLLRKIELGLIDMVIIDELNEFASIQSEHYKFIQKAHKLNPNLKIFGLTGTKSADNIKRFDQSYAELSTILYKEFSKHITEFRRRYGYEGRNFGWGMRHDMQEEIKALYSPFTQCRMSDLKNEMELINYIHEVPYSDEQRKHHNLCRKKLFELRQDEKEFLLHAPATRIDIFSIANGSLPVLDHEGNRTGRYTSIDSHDKKYKLLEVLNSSLNKKALILCSLNSTIQELANLLDSKGIKYAVINGAVSNMKERDRICTAFNNEPALQVIIAAPKSVSYNTRLGNMCNTVIWYGGNLTGYINYKQACARMNASNHKNIHIHHIVSTPKKADGFDYTSLYQNINGKQYNTAMFIKDIINSSDI